MFVPLANLITRRPLRPRSFRSRDGIGRRDGPDKRLHRKDNGTLAVEEEPCEPAKTGTCKLLVIYISPAVYPCTGCTLQPLLCSQERRCSATHLRQWRWTLSTLAQYTICAKDILTNTELSSSCPRSSSRETKQLPCHTMIMAFKLPESGTSCASDFSSVSRSWLVRTSNPERRQSRTNQQFLLQEYPPSY